MIKNYAIIFCLGVISFSAVGQISSGTYKVGVGQAYTTLTAAIADVNNGITGGPVTLLLMDASYSSETFPLMIKTSAGTSASNKLIIKPGIGVSSTISGTSGAAIFKINGAGYVTISGDNGSGGKDLTIINTSNASSSVVWLTSSSTNEATNNIVTNCVIKNTSTSTTSSVVWLASSSTKGATNNTISNCVITGNSSTTTFADIFSGGSTVGIGSNATAQNSYNTFQNNTISKGQNGIYVIGMSASSLDQNLKILNNTLGSSTAGDGFVLSGITAKFQTSATISNNDIQNLVYNSTSIVSLVDAAGNKINVGLYLFNSTGNTVASNKIHNINISSAGTTIKRCYGLSVESPAFNTSSSPANNVVYNNMICDARLSGSVVSTTWAYSGINENGGYGDQFYFNSVRLNGTFATIASSYAAFSNGNGGNTTASPLITVKDNIFDVDAAVGASGSNFYGFYDKLAIANSWDYNDYNIQVTTGNGYTGYFNSTAYTSLTAWQTATGKEPNSKNIIPVFRSTSDLHLPNCTGENSGLNGYGQTVPAITTDIDGDTRASSPDMGCDEFTPTQIFWTGATSTNWNIASNWSCNAVPTATSDVFIPLTSNQPQLITAVLINSVHIDNGATIDLNNKQLTVNTTFSGTGTLTGSATSKLVIKGTAGTVYFASPSPKNELQKLTVQSTGTLQIGSSLYIDGGTAGAYGTVIVDGALNANGFLTIGSNANGTAMIGNSAGTITGDVTVERYIPARRAWRFLTVPFSSSQQFINDAWQEGQTIEDHTICPTNDPTPPGYGTEITNDNQPNTGYDDNSTSNPSIKVWEGTRFDNPIDNTTITNIRFKDAYCLFVRGDRHICLNGINTPNSTVLRAGGILNQTGGINSVTKSRTGGTAGDYFLLGNPYASTIDLTYVVDGSRSGNNGFNTGQIRVWDPKLPGSYGEGAYVTWTDNGSGTGGTWAPTDDGSGNPGSYPAGSDNPPLIESGQAFMVQTNASTANVQFQESDKSTSELDVFGKNANDQKSVTPVIYTNLMASDKASLIDGVATVFADRFSASVDDRDATKLFNKGLNISLQRNGSSLAIEMRPIPNKADTLFFKLDVTPNQYALHIFGKDILNHLYSKGTLIDRYLNTKTDVDVSDRSTYPFTATNDTNSYKNRFMLVLNPDVSSQAVMQATAKNKSLSAMTIFPNPVRGEYFRMTVTGLKPGSYKVSMYDVHGTAVMVRDLAYTNNTSSYKFKLDKRLPNGLYMLKLTDINNSMTQSASLILDK